MTAANDMAGVEPWAVIAAGLALSAEDDFAFWWKAKGAEWSTAFPQWLASEHYGDCTKQPITCMRCFAEHYAPMARAIVAALAAVSS